VKEVHVDSPQVQSGFYAAQPHIEKRHWPYRSQTPRANLSNLADIAPAEFDATKCPLCGGKGRKWVPKNARTGSLRNVPCECSSSSLPGLSPGRPGE